MGEPANPAVENKGWVAPFGMRLCLIAWSGMIFTETIPVRDIKMACILFGSHAAFLACAVCLPAWLRFRQAKLFGIMVGTVPPLAYFLIVLQKFAIDKGWLS